MIGLEQELLVFVLDILDAAMDLAVQLREQSTFGARLKSVEALEAFFVSLADYQAATMSL